MYDGNMFHNYGSIILGRNIRCIFVDDHDNKWVATDKALTKFNELSSTIVYIRENSGLPTGNITQVAQDGNGII